MATAMWGMFGGIRGNTGGTGLRVCRGFTGGFVGDSRGDSWGAGKVRDTERQIFISFDFTSFHFISCLSVHSVCFTFHGPCTAGTADRLLEPGACGEDTAGCRCSSYTPGPACCIHTGKHAACPAHCGAICSSARSGHSPSVHRVHKTAPRNAFPKETAPWPSGGASIVCSYSPSITYNHVNSRFRSIYTAIENSGTR